MALDKVKDDMLQDNLVFPGSTTQFPSITTTQRDALSSVQPGTMIYNSTIGKLQQYDGNNAWATIDSPPVITSVTYPTESGAVLTALDADGSSDAAQTLIINGSNFSSTSEISVQIQVSGSYVAFASSISVNSSRNQITCTGVTKRAAADDYVIKVTNVSGLSATTTVNFSADPSFSTAANLGTVLAGTFTKSIAFTGTAVLQGATAKPTWMTVTGNAPSGSDANGSGATTFLATGSPATLGGTATNTGTSQNYTFSIIVRDAENQTFNRDFSLTVASLPIGGTIIEAANYNGSYRSHKFLNAGNGSSTNNFVLYGATVCDILMVAGGGGGGYDLEGDAGGGGAGGMRVITSTTLSAGTYTISVGAGGNGGSSPSVGGDTTMTGQTAAAGGGYGASQVSSPGANGGSGGGGGGESNTSGGTGAGSLGTNGNNAGYYGGDGGTGNDVAGNTRGGAGGGGASQDGQDATSSDGGHGGEGLQNNFETGNAQWYAAGGSGGHKNLSNTAGPIINGISGKGGDQNASSGSGAPTAGVDGTGAGGGGGYGATAGQNSGGDGVVIIRYAI